MPPVRGFEDYALLPEPIKFTVSREEYAWMSDAEKQDIWGQFTEPDISEDPPE